MVINDKALLRNMKEAYKGWGYTVAVTKRDVWVIRCPHWIARICDRDNVPNEVLSLIVLHMGYLPEEETAYRVYKTDTGPAIQKEIFDEELESLRTMESERIRTSVSPEYIQKTKLHFGACRVWQQPESQQIFLVDPQYESIIGKKNDVRTVRTALCAAGEISSVYVFRERPDGNEAQIEHLQQMRWVGR